jgi:hypothetical protein
MRDQGKCLEKKPSCHQHQSPQATNQSLHFISFSDRVLQILHDRTIVELIDSNARLLEEGGALQRRLASLHDKNTKLRRRAFTGVLEELFGQSFLTLFTEEEILEGATLLPLPQDSRAVVDMPKPETLVFGLDGQLCFEIMGDRTICNLEEENSKLREENRRYLEEVGVLRDQNIKLGGEGSTNRMWNYTVCFCAERVLLG